MKFNIVKRSWFLGVAAPPGASRDTSYVRSASAKRGWWIAFQPRVLTVTAATFSS